MSAVRLALFGATGGTGFAVLKESLRKNYKVRNPDSLPADLKNNANLTVLKGDAKDSAAVESVVKEANHVVVSLGGRPENKSICSEAQPIINAAVNKTNPDAKMILVSSLGVGDSYEHIGWLTTAFVKWIIPGPIADKCLQEDSVKKEMKNYTFVRPGGLSDKPATGKIDARPDVSGGMITREDVGNFIVRRVIEGGEFQNTGVSIVNN